MRVGDQVEVTCPQVILSDAHHEIVSQAHGKSVLNVGAAGGVDQYLPGNRQAWLHHRLGEVAGSLLGADIDDAAMAHARAFGVELIAADCQSHDFGRSFDLIVLSDVIEHLDAPGLALVNLTRQLSAGGRLLITTPNPTALGQLAAAMTGGSTGTYWDHMAAFSPEHIQALCDRHGLVLHRVGWFSLADRRTTATRLKSRIQRLAGGLRPRLHTAFLAEVGRAE